MLKKCGPGEEDTYPNSLQLYWHLEPNCGTSKENVSAGFKKIMQLIG
jgi:hypothetical protein